MKKKKIGKHKNKSKSPKKKVEKDIPKQIGTYHDFLVYDKDDINKDNKLELQNFDFEDPALKVWLAHQDNQYKTQSRFSNLFKEIMDNDRKMSQEGQKSTENKEKSEDKIDNNKEDKKKEDEKKIEDKKDDNNLIFEINNNIIKDEENKNEKNINKDNNINNIINNNIDNNNNNIVQNNNNIDNKNNNNKLLDLYSLIIIKISTL
jgi:hypothetical protein